MDPEAVLAKVVKAWPNLLPFGTITRRTTEAPVSAVLGHDLVNALFVSVEIIVGTETVGLGAPANLAFVGFRMPEAVFPGTLLPTEARAE